MTRLATSFVLGYHGCDKSVADRILGDLNEHLSPSTEAFDWLGTGAYFWEADPRRALEWATERTGRRALRGPCALGAVIDLRNCLDLTVREDIATLSLYFDRWKQQVTLAGLPMPENEDRPQDPQADKLLRFRDCALINFMHESIAAAALEAEAAGRRPLIEPFDTVRGMFQEGPTAYERAGFRTKTHTQIAVINADCIQGYFRPRPHPSEG